MRILGIESSCDETAAAVIESNKSRLRLLSNVVASSVDLHAEFGGVVPEIAARSHLEHINPVIKQAMAKSNSSWKDIDAIAVTQGPGLGGSLLVGVLSARTLAIFHEKPLYAVNHVLAHPYAALFEYDLEFPMLALIVSGGHSQIVLFKTHTKYEVLGRTLDDAVGEAFDKVAKVLGLSYPGGPSVEKAGVKGDSVKYRLPESKLPNPFDFSFSGLKTAVLRTAQAEIGESYNFPSHQISARLSETQRNDIAASFQKTALSTLANKLAAAEQKYLPKQIIVAGGVASSQALRQIIRERIGTEVIYPAPYLCTDNAAMIAARAAFHIESGTTPVDAYSLEAMPDLKM
jgi:N6-L-threonylcarbamoyladenine synthase